VAATLPPHQSRTPARYPAHWHRAVAVQIGAEIPGQPTIGPFKPMARNLRAMGLIG